jgi:hypothetical protein
MSNQVSVNASSSSNQPTSICDPVANKQLIRVHNTISNFSRSSRFEKAITDRIAPAYSSRILNPLCLKSVGAQLRKGDLSTDDYERNMMLMFANAVMYYGPGSTEYDDARDVRTVLAWGHRSRYRADIIGNL